MSTRPCRLRLPLVVLSLCAVPAAAFADGAGVTRLINRSSTGVQGALSSTLGPGRAASQDGRKVVFLSKSANLVPGDIYGKVDVFVRDLDAGTTEVVSVSSSGAFADGDCLDATISADGRYVAFVSLASNLAAGDSNGYEDVYWHDRVTGITQRVSVDSQGVGGPVMSNQPSISADGRFVAFRSYCVLVPDDSNGNSDAYVRDLQTGVTIMASRGQMNGQPTRPTGASAAPAISGDGRYVAFETNSPNVVDGDTLGVKDVFVRDLLANWTVRISQRTVNGAVVEADGPSHSASLSHDGALVCFASDATNLVDGDFNFEADIFVRARTGVTPERVSVGWSGSESIHPASWPSMSSDGRRVAFLSAGTDLVPGDSLPYTDVFVRDRVAGTTMRWSVADSGTHMLGSAARASISGDGSAVAFFTSASNLVANDSNLAPDVFLRREARGAVGSYCTPSPANALGCQPHVAWTGTPSATAMNGFVLRADSVVNQKTCLLFYGMQSRASVPFGGAVLCVRPPLQRTPVRSSGGSSSQLADCSGSPSIDINAFAHGSLGGSPSPLLSLPGTAVCAQWWTRDASSSGGTALSDAVEFIVGD